MEFGELQQEKIKRESNENPLEAYFLGGLHLVSKQKQNETIKYLKRLKNDNLQRNRY